MNDEFHEIPQSPREQKKSERMCALVGDREFKRCLDVGCGIGHMTRYFADRCDKLYGIDLDPGTIKYISRLFALHQPSGKYHFEVVDLEKVDFCPQYVQDLFGENQFDLIIFTDVMPYLSKEARTKVAKNIEKMLDPERGLLLVTHHAPKIPERIEYRTILENAGLWLLLEEVFHASTYWLFQIFSRWPQRTTVNEG